MTASSRSWLAHPGESARPIESIRTSGDKQVLAPRSAPRCHCVAGDIMALRDEDGDWSCHSCGRLLRPAMARFRHIRAAVSESSLLAG
jgi:hypothetical protein